jgi:glutamate dehydrogenase
MTAPSPPRINGNSGSSTPARTPRSGTPIATHLALTGKNYKINEKTGYTDTRFAGKEEQFQKVVKALKSKGFIPNELVDNEVRFYPNECLVLTSIVRLVGFTAIWALMMHILLRNPSRLLSIIFYRSMAQKLLLSLAMIPISKFASIERSVIMLSTLTLPNLVYQISRDLNMSNGNVLSSPLLMVRIDARYLNGSTPARAYRLETFRSMGAISVTSTKQIRCYFVTKCDFVNPNPTLEEMRDLRICGDKNFLEKVTENTLAIYQGVVDAVLQRSGMQLHVNPTNDRSCD